MSRPIDDETLQRFYDGDLSAAEERSVQAAIDADPALQKKLARMQGLGDLLRAHATEISSGLDADAMFAKIEKGIASEGGAGAGERLRVISSEWREHKKVVWMPVVGVTAMAAAALLAFIATRPNEDEIARSKVVKERVRIAEAPAVPAAPSAPVPSGSSIEDVDFGARTGTVFEVENSGVKTAVVWIADEELEEGP